MNTVDVGWVNDRCVAICHIREYREELNIICNDIIFDDD